MIGSRGAAFGVANRRVQFTEGLSRSRLRRAIGAREAVLILSQRRRADLRPRGGERSDHILRVRSARFLGSATSPIQDVGARRQQNEDFGKKFREDALSGATTHFEKANETENMSIIKKNLKDIENVKQFSFKYENNKASTLFINEHLNELRALLNSYSLQERKQGHRNNLPMSYSEAITYCDYIECEISKLQDLLIDFQLQTSTFISDVRRPIDNSASLMKIANLEMTLNETCKNYETAKRDCSKYQDQLLNAAEREVIQQENFTAEETYWLEKMCQAQAENLRYLDIVNALNEEIELLHLELHERDCQLEHTASSLRVLSSQSSVLQQQLQRQEKNVEELEDQLLSNNIKLQKALSYLDLKNKLIHISSNEDNRMKGSCRELKCKKQRQEMQCGCECQSNST